MTQPGELYACLYANEFPVQTMLRLRPELRHKPVVVMEGEPPLQSVCSQRKRTCPRRRPRHDARRDRHLSGCDGIAALPSGGRCSEAVLLEGAGTFSPRAFVAVIDITGTERLLGPPAALASALLARVRALGIASRIAVSGNFHVGVCLALGMSLQRDVTIIAPGEDDEALSMLPLAVLDLCEAHAETFSLWGIE